MEWDRTMVWRKKGGIKKSLSAGDRESEAASFSTGEKERGKREEEGGTDKKASERLGESHLGTAALQARRKAARSV